MTCLKALAEPACEAPVEASVVVGPGLVHANIPLTSKTYAEYCLNEIKNTIIKMSEGVDRVDIVFDASWNITMKHETRKHRGCDEGVRVSLKKYTPIHYNFSTFLRNNQNKQNYSF